MHMTNILAIISIDGKEMKDGSWVLTNTTNRAACYGSQLVPEIGIRLLAILAGGRCL
jgi:hypothetical protein